MPNKIVNIEPQKRNKERFNIYLDSGEVLGINSYILVKHKLAINKELSQESLQNIVLEENLELCKQKAFDLISRRPRSKNEIEQKLKTFLFKRVKKKELKNKIIKEVFKTLKKYDYLDDKKFAKWIVEQRKAQLKGPLYIKRDLLFKGIDKEIIKEVLEQVSFKEEIEKAFEKILKKTRKEKDLYKKKRKIYAYLARQGFYIEDINEVLQKLN